MPTTSPWTVPIPNIDLTSLLLDGIPDHADASTDANFTQPYLLSAENPSCTLSLIELKHHARCFASGLRKQGLQPGEHLMLVSPNYIHSTIVTLGTVAAGGVFCAAQPDLKIREYVDQFLRDEPEYLLVADEQPQCQVVLDAWKASGRSVEGRVWLFCETLDNSRVQSASPHWTQLLDLQDGPLYAWDRLKATEHVNKPCMLFTTSGTSGLRKAAIFSHRNLVASLIATSYRAREDVMAVMKAGKAPYPDPIVRTLHTISISRAMGTALPLALILAAKARPMQVLFMAKTYVAMRSYLEAVQRLKINELSLAPFTLAPLFKQEHLKDNANFDFSH